MKRLDVAVCDAPELVAVCCVLHNICKLHGEKRLEVISISHTVKNGSLL